MSAISACASAPILSARSESLISSSSARVSFWRSTALVTSLTPSSAFLALAISGSMSRLMAPRQRLDVGERGADAGGVADTGSDRAEQLRCFLGEPVDVAEQAADLRLVLLQDAVEGAHHRRARLEEV